MAKISMVAREVKRKALVKKYAAKRAELKKRAAAGDYEAVQELQALPRMLPQFVFTTVAR